MDTKKAETEEMTKPLTKAEKAFRIIQKHDESKRPTEVVRLIMKQCGLKEGAAWTYLYNQRKRVGRSIENVVAELAFMKIDDRLKRIDDVDHEDYNRRQTA